MGDPTFSANGGSGFIAADIAINVLEGRHFAWPDMNSAVIIRVDRQQKISTVQYGTDAPYFNEYFVFEFITTLEKLIDKQIYISVIKPGGIIKSRKILGELSLDIATVWNNKDHQFFHKWAILSTPKTEQTFSVRGFLKLDITILTKGEIPKIPLVTSNEEIEGNLLLPGALYIERQQANFMFDIYKGEDLVKSVPTIETFSNENRTYIPSTYIKITFAGKQVKTNVKKNTSNPVWNETLNLLELFPPLSHRFRIELCHNKSVIATRFLNLSHISSDKAGGFLPTFGPCFLHFYSENPLKGYVGKVLMALRTRLLSPTFTSNLKRNYITPAPRIPEDKILDFQAVALYAKILSVNLIDKKYSSKPIAFRISCGSTPASTLYYIDEEKDYGFSLRVLPKPIINGDPYYYLPLENEKLFLSLTTLLPEVRKRMFSVNMLMRLADELKIKMEEIEEYFIRYDHITRLPYVEKLYKECLDLISQSTTTYIKIISSWNLRIHCTQLDRERVKLLLQELADVRKFAKSMYGKEIKKRNLQKMEKIQTRLTTLAQNWEEWPDIYIWMIYGNNRVAYASIDPQDIIYSHNNQECGINCGSAQIIYLQSDAEEKVQDSHFISGVCRVEISMIMGLASELSYNNFMEEPRMNIPNIYCLRVYIFQGRIIPGFDSSGLSDCFIKFIFENECKTTQVKKATLNPIWDQMLTFEKVILWSPKWYYRAYPPKIFIEVFDEEFMGKPELVGRATEKVCVTADVADAKPCQLSWVKVYNEYGLGAEILATFELLENPSDNIFPPGFQTAIVDIPKEIKPNLINYKVEIYFWGVRNLKKIQLLNITKPKIEIECVNIIIKSDTIFNIKKSLNFSNPLQAFEVLLPEQKAYCPPLTVKLYDSRPFGVKAFGGTHIAAIRKFIYVPLTITQRQMKIENLDVSSTSYDSDISFSFGTSSSSDQQVTPEIPTETKEKKSRCACCFAFLRLFTAFKKKPIKKFDERLKLEEEDFDWWTKFYASLQKSPTVGIIPLSHKYKLIIYPNELEKQPEFKGFFDGLHNFPIYKGKRTGDEAVDEENTTAIFKGAIKIYRWPPPNDITYVNPRGMSLERGFFQNFPENNQLWYVLRVYCVRAINLRPKDLNGKCDPYLSVQLGNKTINDRENAIMRQVNPVFGRCFEFTASFPRDHTLIIDVYDYDIMTGDDLIGTTKIDIENRFYSKHRGQCGLPEFYFESGYCAWRDSHKPTTIMEGFCQLNNLKYSYTASSVKIGNTIFTPEDFQCSGNKEFDRQVIALYALRNWDQVPVIGCHLVPEHVETRSLFDPAKLGLEQGKLQMWVDILVPSDLPPPKVVDIIAPQPASYELRVIVWNVEKIILDEYDLITGEQKSDIYVSGWIGDANKIQYTDVHYRSLNGEGNFNWRFIFRIDYLKCENKLVIKKKLSIFETGETEFKVPCKLTLQVWDNDTISGDDFLGILALDLDRMPHGATNSKFCDLNILSPQAEHNNLFRIKRTRGWWPFRQPDPKERKYVFAGCIDLELQILSIEDADDDAAGLGRNPPQQLPFPNRPDCSFSWFFNPWKAFKYLIYLHKGKMICIVIILIAILMGAVTIYAFPNYAVKKLLGAKK